ncbi:MAG: RnfABCDGE type electron transport complex subunit D [Candidatus Omnitrophota bacterium]
MQNQLIVSVSPHLHAKEDTANIMWQVALALAPAGVAGIWLFGMPALKVIIISITSCLLFELIIQKLRHTKITIFDGSAFLTGLLLAYNLPSQVPFWIPILGSIFAILITKHTFGGLGKNIFNPALAARVFLLVSFAKYLTRFTQPIRNIGEASYDTVTQATPLMAFKETNSIAISNWNLFLGNHAGSLGEVCIIALLIGAIFLLVRKIISWHIPISFILSVALLDLLTKQNILFNILAGGLILGAFFMATDYVTSPLTNKGKIIFGIGCGVITFVIRKWGGYPEGVSFSILIMNAAVPIIDRYATPRRYGIVKSLKSKV